jgi:hypothetical protein
MSRSAFVSSWFLFLVAFAQPQAWAQSNGSPQAACPAGNLLAHKAPTAWQEVRRELSLLTDETVAPEGAIWDAPLAAILETGASTVTWDLGEVTNIRVLAVQADANDTYNVWGSLDGQTYKLMGQIDPAAGHGLRMRTLDVGAGMPARFLRVGEGKGDSFYSVSEVAAYCQTPSPFPPQMKVVDAPAATAPKSYLDYWNNDVSAHWEMILAMLGAILLWWERRLVGLGMAAFKLRLRRIILGVMGVLAFFTFFNFGFWHFPNFIHGWDTFHYYIGSKYFKELHYERLYECVATADAEEPLLRRRVELRKLTNLRTNVVETTDDILAHPERCKVHFTPARWEAFKQDLRYFRTLENPRRWDDAQTDHGFNGTPVWNILGSILTNITPPASHLTVVLLDSLDVVMLTLMTGLLWWAFGWRVVSVALIVFATNFPSRWYWIGGSYLRWDWLFWMGVGVCMMKKERPFWAGAAVMYAALLRIFPGFLFVAPLIALLVHYVKTREWDRRFVRLFLGAAVAFAVLIPVSFATSGGPTIYGPFIRNTIKHSETPLTNYMGLRTVIAFRPSQTADRMNAPGMTDPWLRWKEARLKAAHEAMPLYASLVVCFLVLVTLAIRGVDPWVTLVLSATLITFGSELTCYYYAFLIIPALLYAVVPRAGEWLMWLTALTQFIGWAPISHVPQWMQKLMPAAMRQSPLVTSFGMPKGLDEQYTWMSLLTLIVFVLIAWDLYQKQKAALAAPQLAETAAASGTGAAAGATVESEGAVPAAQVLAPATVPAGPSRGKARKKRRR